MPYAKTDDRVKIYYEEHGQGFPLVLAYGIGGSTTMWEPNIKALAANYRLILWDPRGHGRSQSPEDPARYSFRRWALDLRDLLNHLGIRRAYVGGLSMGGGIAVRFTLSYPKRVAALIITNSASASGLPLSAEGLVMREEDQGVQAGRALAGQPLRQPGPAGGMEPGRARVPDPGGFSNRDASAPTASPPTPAARRSPSRQAKTIIGICGE